MERLTQWIDDGERIYAVPRMELKNNGHQKCCDKLASYEDEEEQVLKATGADLQSMIGEFMYYYNMQKEGRLLEFPCKVGDTVYVITSPYNVDDCEENYRQPPQIFECVIESISLYKCGARQYRAFFNNEFVAHYLNDDNFGKTVFLTREEAEAALERMNCNG